MNGDGTARPLYRSLLPKQFINFIGWTLSQSFVSTRQVPPLVLDCRARVEFDKGHICCALFESTHMALGALESGDKACTSVVAPDVWVQSLKSTKQRIAWKSWRTRCVILCGTNEQREAICTQANLMAAEMKGRGTCWVLSDYDTLADQYPFLVHTYGSGRTLRHRPRPHLSPQNWYPFEVIKEFLYFVTLPKGTLYSELSSHLTDFKIKLALCLSPGASKARGESNSMALKKACSCLDQVDSLWLNAQFDTGFDKECKRAFAVLDRAKASGLRIIVCVFGLPSAEISTYMENPLEFLNPKLSARRKTFRKKQSPQTLNPLLFGAEKEAQQETAQGSQAEKWETKHKLRLPTRVQTCDEQQGATFLAAYLMTTQSWTLASLKTFLLDNYVRIDPEWSKIDSITQRPRRSGAAQVTPSADGGKREWKVLEINAHRMFNLLSSELRLLLLDIRSAPQFDAGHIPRSISIPLDSKLLSTLKPVPDALISRVRVSLGECTPQQDATRVVDDQSSGEENLSNEKGPARKNRPADEATKQTLKIQQAIETVGQRHPVIVYDKESTHVGHHLAKMLLALPTGCRVSCVSYAAFKSEYPGIACRPQSGVRQTGIPRLWSSSPSFDVPLALPRCIDPGRLYLGGIDAGSNVAALSALRINRAVLVTRQRRAYAFFPEDIEYLRHDPIPPNFRVAAKTVHGFIRCSIAEGSAVLIQAFNPTSAAAGYAMSWMMASRHLSLTDSYNHVLQALPSLSLSRIVADQLVDFERSLRSHDAKISDKIHSSKELEEPEHGDISRPQGIDSFNFDLCSASEPREPNSARANAITDDIKSKYTALYAGKTTAVPSEDTNGHSIDSLTLVSALKGSRASRDAKYTVSQAQNAKRGRVRFVDSSEVQYLHAKVTFLSTELKGLQHARRKLFKKSLILKSRVNELKEELEGRNAQVESGIEDADETVDNLAPNPLLSIGGGGTTDAKGRARAPRGRAARVVKSVVANPLGSSGGRRAVLSVVPPVVHHRGTITDRDGAFQSQITESKRILELKDQLTNTTAELTALKRQLEVAGECATHTDEQRRLEAKRRVEENYAGQNQVLVNGKTAVHLSSLSKRCAFLYFSFF